MPPRNRRSRERRIQGSGSVYWDEKRQRFRGYVELDHPTAKAGGKRPRKYVSGRTEAEAERKVRDALAERDAGRLDSTASPTVAQWLHRYLAEVAAADVRPRTLTRYRELVDVHIVPELGKTKLERLTPAQVKGLHRTMLRGGSSPSTTRQAHAVLSRALRIGQQWGVVGRNVAALAGGPAMDETEVEPLTTEEALLVVQAAQADPGMGARWLLGLAAGLRQGETLGLEWHLLDLDGPGPATVRVQQQLQRVKAYHGCGDPTGREQVRVKATGKLRTVDVWPCGRRQPLRCPQVVGEGDHPPGLHLLTPKSAASTATIVIPDEVAEALRQHRDQQAVVRRQEGPRWKGWADGGQPRDLVFCRRAGTPIEASADSKAWHQLLERSGIAPARLHALRHTTATQLLLDGEDIKVVQALLRHSTSDFTRRVYQHVTEELETRAAARLSRRLFAVEPDPAEVAVQGSVSPLHRAGPGPRPGRSRGGR